MRGLDYETTFEPTGWRFIAPCHRRYRPSRTNKAKRDVATSKYPGKHHRHNLGASLVEQSGQSLVEQANKLTSKRGSS